MDTPTQAVLRTLDTKDTPVLHIQLYVHTDTRAVLQIPDTVLRDTIPRHRCTRDGPGRCKDGSLKVSMGRDGFGRGWRRRRRCQEGLEAGRRVIIGGMEGAWGALMVAIRDTIQSITCIACSMTSIAHSCVCAILPLRWYCGYWIPQIHVYCTYHSIAHTARNAVLRLNTRIQMCPLATRVQGARNT